MFATILTLCTYASCNYYTVDSASTMSDCNTNLNSHALVMKDTWMNDRKLEAYLKKHAIKTPVKMLQVYDYKCVYIVDDLGGVK